MLPSVGVLFGKPIPPIHSSLACVVAAVVPVVAAVPVLLALAVWSAGLASTPLYSITTPEQRPVRVVNVTVVPALALTGADQISVVVPVLTDCPARVQTAPVEAMEVI